MFRWMDEAYSNVSKLLIHCKPYSRVSRVRKIVFNLISGGRELYLNDV